jgi:hypothetical protein
MIATAVLLLTATAVHGQLGEPQWRHVRSRDSVVISYLEEGCRRSATFRQIVDELEHSDVIVHLERSGAVRSGCTGQLQFAAAAGGRRYLRVRLDPSIHGPRFLAAIGHELAHACEVARAREVVDNASLRRLYCCIGHASRFGYCTSAARAAGIQILLELTVSPTRDAP